MKRRKYDHTHDEFGPLHFYVDAATWITPPIFGPFYDQDAGGGGGGPGGGKDGEKDPPDNDKKGADGKAGGESKPETYPVKIGGVEKQLTLEELTEYASKAAGADEKFREAAELRKAADKAQEQIKAFEKVFNSDNVTASDVRKLAELMGQDPDELEKMFTEEVKKMEAEKDKGGKGGKSSAGASQKIRPEDLPDDMRQTLEQAQQFQIKEAEKEIARQVQEEVDKDKFFGKIIDETPAEQRENRKAALTAMVQRDVRAKILASPYTKERFGTDMIRTSIQEIRAEVTKFGIPSKQSQQASPSLLAALGSAGGLPAEVHSDQDIKRVPSTESSYEENVVARLGQKFVQAIRGKK